MKFPTFNRRIITLALAILFVASVTASASAAVRSMEKESTTSVMSFSKNGKISKEIKFYSDDFKVSGDANADLDSIIITSLPEHEAGVLMVGDELLAIGDVISVSAIEAMRFCPLVSPTLLQTSFQFAPVFSNGDSGQQCKVNLYLLSEDNHAPVAENLEFITYKNVAYTGLFSAVDPEGDVVTFQLVDKPARGAVELDDDGGAEFVYTPYENKVGKDSFTYVGIDSFGNVSEKATVKIRIDKPSTKVTYADMSGHPAYNAALRLAEEGIYIGANMDGAYYFQPDIQISRAEFLAMAMSAWGSEVLEGVTKT